MTNLLNPTHLWKSAGDDIRFGFDWTHDLDDSSIGIINSATWSVVSGSIDIGVPFTGRAPYIEGNITYCYVCGGIPWEPTQLSCSVTLDTGDQIVKTFTLIIREGAFVVASNEPGTLDFPLDSEM